jgi:hypothetical protein
VVDAPTASYGPPAPATANGPRPAPHIPPAPGDGPRDPRSAALAVVALCLAVGGAIVALLPVLNLLAAPVLIAAFVCALIALIGRRHGGKGLSIAALATSAATGIIAAVLIVGSALLFGLGGLWSWTGSGLPFHPYSDGYTDETYPGEDGFGNDYPNGDLPDDGSVEYGADLDLVQGEVAFARFEADQTAWWYGVFVDNPNPDAIFENAVVLVEAVDGTGAVVDSDDAYVTLQPGTTVIAGLFIEAGDATITDLRVTLPDAADARLLTPEENGAVMAQDIQSTTTGSLPLVTGRLVNTTPLAQEFAQAVVVARDPEGTIIAVEPGYVDTIEPGGDVPFEVYFYDPLPAGVTFEVYVTL